MMDENLIEKAIEFDLKEGDSLIGYLSDCHNAPICFTETSGVYLHAGIYCFACHKLL